MNSTYRYILAAAAASFVLSGCSAILSTTNTTARTLQSTTDGITNVSQTTSQTGQDSSSSKDAEARRFVHSRIAAIRRQAAAGHGEDLVALAALMHAHNPQAFSHWMQTNYQPLFNNLQKPEQLVTRIHTLRG